MRIVPLDEVRQKNPERAKALVKSYAKFHVGLLEREDQRRREALMPVNRVGVRQADTVDYRIDWIETQDMPKTARQYTAEEVRFASRLRPLRELRNLSQEKLAQQSGIAQSSISKMEVGAAGVNLGAAMALCRALQVNLQDMIGEGELYIVTVK